MKILSRLFGTLITAVLITFPFFAVFQTDWLPQLEFIFPEEQTEASNPTEQISDGSHLPILNPNTSNAVEIPSGWSAYLSPNADFSLVIPPNWDKPVVSRTTHATSYFFDDQRLVLTVGQQLRPGTEDFKTLSESQLELSSNREQQTVNKGNETLEKYVQTEGTERQEKAVFGQSDTSNFLAWLSYRSPAENLDTTFDSLLSTFALHPQQTNSWASYQSEPLNLTFNHPQGFTVETLGEERLLMYESISDLVDEEENETDHIVQVELIGFESPTLREQVELLRLGRQSENPDLELFPVQKVFIGERTAFGFVAQGSLMNTSYLALSWGEGILVFRNSVSHENQNPTTTFLGILSSIQ